MAVDVSGAMSRSRFVMFLVSFSLLLLGANGQNYSVTIEVDPVLASYTVGNTVTLECVVDPVITDTNITPMYLWQCDTGCFADGMTTPTITRQLTDMDSGVIECSVTIDGDVYMSDNMFDLQVSQAPTPIITFNPTSPVTGAMVGSPQDIDCIVNTTVPGVSSVSISWTGPGKVPIMSNTNRVTISLTTSSGIIFNSSLQFDYLTEDDEGTYTCNVMILDASANQSIELQSLTVPTPVVSITPPVTQIVGDPLTLQCEVTTVRGITSRVDIVWSSGGTVLRRINGTTPTTMGNSLVYTDSLNILQLSTTADGRVIQCEIVINTSPSVMATDSITLDVTVPTPTVAISPSGPIQGAMVGSSQNIQCTVSTVSGVESSSVMISWMGPRGNIDATNGRVSIGSVTNDGNNMYTRSLQFTYLMEGDKGNYSCNVIILDASTTQSIELQSLTVSTPTVNVTALNTQTVGQSQTLQCEMTTVTGVTSRVDIVWSSGGMELERMNVSSTTMDNSLVYTHSYTISQLYTTDDGRVIQCEVVINTSPLVMATDSITLDVTVPTPTVTISPSGPIQGAMVGSSQNIQCTVSTVIGVESISVMISWIGPGGNIDVTNGRVSIGSVTDDGNNMYTRSLQFTYLMEGDEGTYTCNVMILDVSVTQSIELQSLTVPDPTVSVTALNTQTVSQSLTLQCEVTTVRGITSRVDIVWNSGGIELERMNGVSSTTINNSLVYTDSYTISQLSTSDDGRVIQCEVVINASPPVMATDSITLDVTVPNTTVTLSPSGLLQVMVGSPQNFQCTVSTVGGVESSAVMISWNGPGGYFFVNNSRVSIGSVIDIGNDTYTSSFHLDYLRDGKFGDEGTYTCKVMILETSGSQSVDLELTIPLPTVSVTAPNTQIVGQSLTLQCEVTTVRGIISSLVDIVWSSNGTELERIYGVSLTTMNNSQVYTDSYTISHLNTTDDGRVIQCEIVINALRSPSVMATDSITLDVIVPNPIVLVTVSNTQTVGQSLTLQCEVTAVRGITSRVDIVWSSGSVVLRRTNDKTATTMDNLLVYIDSYTISELNTADNGRIIKCEVVINTSPPILDDDKIALDVIVPTPTVTMSPSGPIQGAMVGSPQVIICTVSTVSGVESSSVIISWMGPGGDPIATDCRVTISPTTSSGNNYTSSLQFDYLMEGDEGMYTCNVKILEASASDSVVLSLNSVCSSTSSTDSQASSDDNNGATLIVLIVMVVIMAIGLIVAVAIIILLMRKVKQLKSQYVISQREGGSIKDESVTKLPKKSEVIYETVDADETQYDKPSAISATQNTAISMQENPAYRINKPKI